MRLDRLAPTKYGFNPITRQLENYIYFYPHKDMTNNLFLYIRSEDPDIDIGTNWFSNFGVLVWDYFWELVRN